MPPSLRALLVFAGAVAVYVSTARRAGDGFPLWVPVVLLAGLAWALWFAFERPIDLRRAKGLCLHCGYDLTGNVSGVCPECGAPTP